MPGSCLQSAGGRVQERSGERKARRKGKGYHQEATPFTHVLNSSPELEGLKRAEKKTATERTGRLQPRSMVPSQAELWEVVQKSCHLGEEQESLAFVLLVLLVLAPL